jgi:hypothetical protein
MDKDNIILLIKSAELMRDKVNALEQALENKDLPAVEKLRSQIIDLKNLIGGILK